MYVVHLDLPLSHLPLQEKIFLLCLAEIEAAEAAEAQERQMGAGLYEAIILISLSLFGSMSEYYWEILV